RRDRGGALRLRAGALPRIGGDGVSGPPPPARMRRRRARGRRAGTAAAEPRARAQSDSDSYLNDSFTLARYVWTLPSCSAMSGWTISAIRRSRSDFAACWTAAAAAFSQDSLLEPTSSITLY